MYRRGWRTFKMMKEKHESKRERERGGRRESMGLGAERKGISSFYSYTCQTSTYYM
jgi:hypothetical protein